MNIELDEVLVQDVSEGGGRLKTWTCLRHKSQTLSVF